MAEHDERESENGHDKEPKTFPVKVNNKPVELPRKEMTGHEIKHAAIAQGVQIQEDFVLQVEKENGEFDNVGNHTEVNVKKHTVFTAIAPDDNS